MAASAVNITDSAGSNSVAPIGAATGSTTYATGLVVRSVEAAPNSGLVVKVTNVSGSAVQITSASPNNDRRKVKVKNGGYAKIFLGNSGVLISTGYQLEPGEVDNFDVGPGLPIFAVSAVANNTVFVLELS